MSDKAAHRLVSMITHPNRIDGCRIRASVIAKRLMWEQPAACQPAVTPVYYQIFHQHDEI